MSASFCLSINFATTTNMPLYNSQRKKNEKKKNLFVCCLNESQTLYPKRRFIRLLEIYKEFGSNNFETHCTLYSFLLNSFIQLPLEEQGKYLGFFSAAADSTRWVWGMRILQKLYIVLYTNTWKFYKL